MAAAAAAAKLYKEGTATEVEAAIRTYYGACIAQMTTRKCARTAAHCRASQV